MPRLPALALFALASAGPAGCTGREPHTDAAGLFGGPMDGPGALSDELAPSCNPLRSDGSAALERAGLDPGAVRGACLLPYPSAVFLEPDASSSTGYRVGLGSEMFSVAPGGEPYDPARLNAADGFSPASQILAYFPEPLDASTLVPIDAMERSLEPGGATVIVDMDTGERVAHFAELDATAELERGERQALILRPAARLADGRRYAVGITRALRTKDGAPPAPPPGWEAIVSGRAREGPAAKQAERMPEILAALASAGAPREALVVGWDFVTSSQKSQIGALLAMREATLAAIGPEGLGFSIDSIEKEYSEHILLRARGTFKAPRFLSSVDPLVAETRLLLGKDGLPEADGTYDVPFTLLLPRSAATRKVRLLVLGHGFLVSGERELGPGGEVEEDRSHQAFADAHGYALVATDWTGLSAHEGLLPPTSYAAVHALADLNRVPWISDRLHQAMVNGVTLARTARAAIARAPELFVGGEQRIDDGRVDYFGFSLGGILGGVLVALSPDLERAVLHVGGGTWTALFQRSQNWPFFDLVLGGSYPDRLERQVILDVFQEHFQVADPTIVAPHLLSGLFPGEKKQVLLQIAHNDASVPNLASEILARSAKLPLLDASPGSVFGLERRPGPLSSALSRWDLGAEPLPKTNASPPTLSDNRVHLELRALPAAQAQSDRFYRHAEVVSTCEGACDPD